MVKAASDRGIREVFRGRVEPDWLEGHHDTIARTFQPKLPKEESTDSNKRDFACDEGVEKRVPAHAETTWKYVFETMA